MDFWVNWATETYWQSQGYSTIELINLVTIFTIGVMSEYFLLVIIFFIDQSLNATILSTKVLTEYFGTNAINETINFLPSQKSFSLKCNIPFWTYKGFHVRYCSFSETINSSNQSFFSINWNMLFVLFVLGFTLSRFFHKVFRIWYFWAGLKIGRKYDFIIWLKSRSTFQPTNFCRFEIRLTLFTLWARTHTVVVLTNILFSGNNVALREKVELCHGNYYGGGSASKAMFW